jgi:hypothetical protein
MAIRDAVKVSEGARLDFLYGTETLQAERTCYAVAYFIVAIMNGAGGQNRTGYARLFRAALYQ